MKIITLCFCSLLSFLSLQAQWHQYAKPNLVNQMVKDGNGNYHYATDIGYVKFDNAFNVVDFKNLVTQPSPIGNVTSLDVNPLNAEEIAICEVDRVTIWVNGTLSQTIAINSTNPDYNPQIRYNNTNEIYVFDKAEMDYRIISNGAISDVSTPGIRPQDIIENNDGTKVFCAGWNNGLWEYTKASDTWVNYNASNSNLIYDVLASLFVDDSDLLYIGGFQGLNTLDPSGTMTACQQLVGPSDPFFYAVNEIDVNSNGDVLVRSSAPNSGSNYGFCLVDIDTCSWTNYSNDGTNCLDSNSYRTVQFSSSGNEVIATTTDFNSIDTYVFTINAPSPDCTALDFNYLGASDMYRSFGFSEVNIRESNTPGNFDIALTNQNGVDIISVPEENFDGDFPTSTNFDPFTGSSYDVISAGDYFVFTDASNTFTFLNKDGSSTSHTLSIPDFSINRTKKANIDVSGSTCALVFNGFEGPSFDTKLYMTECDMPTGNCTAPVELCANNRDTSEPITFSCTEDPDSDNFRCAAIKRDNMGNIALTKEIVSPENGTESITIDTDISNVLTSIFVDPIFQREPGEDSTELLVSNTEGDTVVSVNWQSGTQTIYNLDNGTFRVVAFEVKPEDPSDPNAFNPLLGYGAFSVEGEGSSALLRKQVKQAIWGDAYNGDRNFLTTLPYTEIPGSIFNDLPQDLFLYSTTIYPYSNTNYATVLMTNYGILIKSEIDSSFLGLSVSDNELDPTLRLFPNPTRDYITFSGAPIKAVEIFDLNGRKVKGASANTISIKSLAKGLYTIKGLTINGHQFVKKVIKN